MSSALTGKKIAVIGGGNMGAAIIQGLLREAVLPGDSVAVAEPDAGRREALSKTMDARLVATAGEALAAGADLVLLAVKPQILPRVLAEISPNLKGPELLVSVAAGVSLASMAALLPKGARLVRAMPNTPALVGEGITALAPSELATADDIALSEALFAGVGRTVRVAEASMNAVTGLSGSGPAYVMLFIESLADGGVHAGLTRPVAMDLAVSTVLGAAKLVQQTGQHPGQLKDTVTSPAGTTIAGVRALEAGGFRHTVIEAVQAATERANALDKS